MLYFLSKGTELTALWSLEARDRKDCLHIQRTALKRKHGHFNKVKIPCEVWVHFGRRAIEESRSHIK